MRTAIESTRSHTDSSVIPSASLSLSTWLEALPPALKLNSHSIRSALPHVLTMHISWASFMIMLHKSFYRPLVNLPTTGNGDQPASNHNAMLAVKVRPLLRIRRHSALIRFAPLLSNAIELLCKSYPYYRHGTNSTTSASHRPASSKAASQPEPPTCSPTPAPGPSANNSKRWLGRKNVPD